MALNPARIARAVSPANSEGSVRKGYVSPLKDQDDVLRKDRNYKRYAVGVERVLSLFDTALQEWADYISFLSRLQKAIQQHPPDIRAVPYKALVARRLAQCMNPGLPSGVHQKTLEVYEYIFNILEKDGLGQDLMVYFPGFASTLSFASLSVRPLFLSLMEDHVLKLSASRLRPSLKAVILALLPGLEEETSEDFERTLSILTQFRRKFEIANGELQQGHSGAAYFWQCLFLTSVTSPSRRMGVLAYLIRYLPRLGSSLKSEESDGDDPGNTVAAICTPEPGLLLRCFATGLTDEQLLVQRSFLDLLVTHIPLHAQELHGRAVHEDLVLLATAALGVVLRRDMSLNRRLWSWFLGPEPKSPVNGNAHFQLGLLATTPQPSYFHRFGADVVTESLLRMVSQKSSDPANKARPFRIALSLMDRWEIGGIVVTRVFVPLLRSVQRYETTSESKEAFEEVFRSSNVFFDGVESVIIWSEIFQLLVPGAQNLNDEELLSNARLVHFIVTRFNISEEEMLSLHIPLHVLAINCMLDTTKETRQQAFRPGARETSRALQDMLLEILHILLELLPDLAFSQKSSLEATAAQSTSDAFDTIRHIGSFYTESKDASELPHPPFAPKQIAALALRHYSNTISEALKSGKTGPELKHKTQLFCMLIQKSPSYDDLLDNDLSHVILQRLSANSGARHGEIPTSEKPHFSLISSITSLTVFLRSHGRGTFRSDSDQFGQIVSNLIKYLWMFLSPKTPQVHVEASMCIWQLHLATLSRSLVASALASLMSQPQTQDVLFLPDGDAIRRFTILWTHLLPKLAQETEEAHRALLDRPLNLVIDVLCRPKVDGFEPAKDWLQSQSSLMWLLRSIVEPLQATVDTFTDSWTEDSLAIAHWQLLRLYGLISVQSDDQWRLFAQTPPGQESEQSLQTAVAMLCMKILTLDVQKDQNQGSDLMGFWFVSMDLFSTLLDSSTAHLLLDAEPDLFLINQLSSSVERGNYEVQRKILDSLKVVLKVRTTDIRRIQSQQLPDDRRRSKDHASPARMPTLGRRPSKDAMPSNLGSAPKDLLDCLLKGISLARDPTLLHKWIELLCDSISLWSPAIFQVLLSIVECFIDRIRNEFSEIQNAYAGIRPETMSCSDSCLLQLLNGLEFCIANAHERLAYDEQRLTSAKSPEIAQGLFGNIVSAASSSETNLLRNAVANNRLTVVLCFQDIARTTFTIWSWNSKDLEAIEQDDDNSASFKHAMLKFRNRCRKILEHLVTAEPLETIETLMELWTTATAGQVDRQAIAILDLLHTLEGTRPRNSIPAVFNASYSRSDPGALDPSRKSTLTSKITDNDVLTFLIIYTRSLEDDVLEEIWVDCMTFLRDILANPMPHRSILPRLMEFVAVLSGKMENTNFGEESKMRRELGDLFTRLLTAIFTIRPPGLDSTASGKSDDVAHLLNEIFPDLLSLLGDTDRLNGVISSISTNIVNPSVKSRSFPDNVSEDLLLLLQKISKVPNASKIWRRDILEFFNDSRVFQTSSSDILSIGWLPLFRQLVLVDKDRLTDVLSRIVAPTTAGIMFGVGAATARIEADKRTQVNLRRIIALLLCAEDDMFAGQYPVLIAKLEELLTATPVTSPSSSTRVEIYMVFRALILKSSSIHLAGLWPIITSELYEGFASIITDLDGEPGSSEASRYSPLSLLQAAKLLDVLLLVRPDDFQLQEWLFVTDNMDAIYPPSTSESEILPQVLADDVGTALQALALPKDNVHGGHLALMSSPALSLELQKPSLASELTRDGKIIGSPGMIYTVLLRPFFSQLSIHAMESTYALGGIDVAWAKDDLVRDLVSNVAE